MRQSIRARFFSLLAVQTALVFVAIGIVLLVFNLHERREHPDLLEEETEEALLVGGAMALLFPLALLSAWWTTRALLRPWQALVARAERISEGHLDERIEVASRDDEIGRLARTLNVAFDRHRDAVRRLDRFVYDASHQLRNPLAAIRAGGEVALKRSRSAEEYADAIGSMLEDTTRLSRTVDKVLLLARVGHGSIRDAMREVVVADVIAEALMDAAAIGEERGVQVVLDRGDSEHDRARAVPELLHEAVSNLLDNALRASPPRSTITVRLSRPQHDMVRIAVEDEGPGVPATLRERLFQPFASGRESTGLGLALVADVCRSHGGTAGMADRAEGGARFTMDLPLVGSAAAPHP